MATRPSHVTYTSAPDLTRNKRDRAGTEASLNRDTNDEKDLNHDLAHKNRATLWLLMASRPGGEISARAQLSVAGSSLPGLRTVQQQRLTGPADYRGQESRGQWRVRVQRQLQDPGPGAVGGLPPQAIAHAVGHERGPAPARPL